MVLLEAWDSFKGVYAVGGMLFRSDWYLASATMPTISTSRWFAPNPCRYLWPSAVSLAK